MTKLSIIVPVYNVEKYVRPCFESIFRQGLDEETYEVIIINDGTKDKSMEMIADIISQHNNITVINQENQGLSVVRNNGIDAAKGEYILMPDSDDMLVDYSVPFLLEQALSSKADLVVADFAELSNEEVEKLQPGDIKQIEEPKVIEKNGEALFMEDLTPYQSYVWRTLFRRQYLIDNNLRFTPGIIFQDVPFVHECYMKAQKCLRTNWLLNIYRRRKGSATFTYTLNKSRDFSIAIGKTWELTHIEGLSPRILRKYQDDVFTSMSVMLWCTSHTAKNASEREKVIDFFKEQAPDLNLRNNAKQKITTFFFRRMPHAFIHLRYFYDIFIVDTLLPFYRHKIKSRIKKNHHGTTD